MKQINVQQGQTIWDLAIQYYGDIQAVFWILEDNVRLGLNSSLIAGSSINIRTNTINQPLRDYLLTKNAVPNSFDQFSLSAPEGIAFWGINEDFVIAE